MLAHTNRFHGYGSLRFLYHRGQSVRTRHMALRYIANKRRVHSRCAVVVSKKVFKSAVKRNRIRRRVFEAIRYHWPQIHGVNDLVVTVYGPEILDAPYELVLAEVEQLLVQAGVVEASENQSH